MIRSGPSVPAFGLVLALLISAAGAAAATSASPTPSFDRVFSAAGEPATLRYTALFVANGTVHRMQVWRDHDRHIKRLTDDTIATYATRQPNGPGYRLTVLDLKRRISTVIDRTNLYRIGAFTDWYDLGHGLRHPKGTYRIVPAAAAPAGMPRIGRACRWYDLIEGTRTTHVCWDAAVKLPLLIAPAGGAPVWRVVSIDQAPIPASTFVANDRGFIRNDANRDIEAD
jgi:hypothetical protein